MCTSAVNKHTCAYCELTVHNLNQGLTSCFTTLVHPIRSSQPGSPDLFQSQRRESAIEAWPSALLKKVEWTIIRCVTANFSHTRLDQVISFTGILYVRWFVGCIKCYLYLFGILWLIDRCRFTKKQSGMVHFYSFRSEKWPWGAVCDEWLESIVSSVKKRKTVQGGWVIFQAAVKK